MRAFGSCVHLALFRDGENESRTRELQNPLFISRQQAPDSYGFFR